VAPSRRGISPSGYSQADGGPLLGRVCVGRTDRAGFVEGQGRAGRARLARSTLDAARGVRVGACAQTGRRGGRKDSLFDVPAGSGLGSLTRRAGDAELAAGEGLVISRRAQFAGRPRAYAINVIVSIRDAAVSVRMID